MNDQAYCTFVQGCLPGLLAGRLALWEAGQVKAHLRRCPACHRAFLKVGAVGIFRAQTELCPHRALPTWLRGTPDGINLTEPMLTLTPCCRPAALERRFIQWVKEAHQPATEDLTEDIFAGLQVCVGNDYY